MQQFGLIDVTSVLDLSVHWRTDWCSQCPVFPDGHHQSTNRDHRASLLQACKHGRKVAKIRKNTYNILVLLMLNKKYVINVFWNFRWFFNVLQALKFIITLQLRYMTFNCNDCIVGCYFIIWLHWCSAFGETNQYGGSMDWYRICPYSPW